MSLIFNNGVLLFRDLGAGPVLAKDPACCCGGEVEPPYTGTCPDLDCGFTLDGTSLTKYANAAAAPDCGGNSFSAAYPEAVFAVWYGVVGGLTTYVWYDALDNVHVTDCNTGTGDMNDSSMPCEWDGSSGFQSWPAGNHGVDYVHWYNPSTLGFEFIIRDC